MLIFPLALGGGVVAGYAGGGRLHGLGLLQLRAPLLVVAALLAQLGLPAVDESLRNPIVALSYGMVGAWLVVNLARRSLILRVAIGLLAIGWMLNIAPIAANGAMPVSVDALGQIGGPPADDIAAGNIDKHVAAGPGTPLGFLGDVIAVTPLRAVVSIGDVVMVVGIVLIVAAAMASARHRGEREIPRKEVP